MTTNDPDRIVTVRIFDNLTEAITARAMLEAAEIDCFLADEHTYRIAGPFHAVFGINGVRLQVRAEDLERAATMLESPPGAVICRSLSSLGMTMCWELFMGVREQQVLRPRKNRSASG
jgi:hypothetical protein